MQGKLRLADAPETLVFAAVRQILQDDRSLSRVVAHWKTWEGRPDDAAEFTSGALPAVRLTPAPQDTAWQFPDSQAGSLHVLVEMALPGYRAADWLNLWHAVRRALSPRDDPAATPPNAGRLAVQQRLVAAGSQTGMPDFGAPRPPADDVDNPGVYVVTAVVRIDLQILMNA